jgi:hypothetical protein
VSQITQITCSGQTTTLIDSGIFKATRLNSQLYTVDIKDVTSGVVKTIQVYIGYIKEDSYIIYNKRKYVTQQELIFNE